jgi:hypothetical protein
MQAVGHVWGRESNGIDAWRKPAFVQEAATDLRQGDLFRANGESRRRKVDQKDRIARVSLTARAMASQRFVE